MRTFTAHWLGRMRYAQAHALQERLLDRRIRGAVGDTLLLVEHEPVITLGRGARESNILLPKGVLAARGVDLHETARGGDVTYHGPGQLVAYPIFDLRPERCDVRRYIRDLARVVIDLCRDQGIEASFIEGDSKLVGIWVDRASPAKWLGDPREPGGATDPAKIGAIGVRISRWVTMHGFSYNLSVDPSGFDLIVPCGITQYGVTSVAALGFAAPSVQAAARAAVAHFEKAFEAEGVLAQPSESAAWLEAESAAAPPPAAPEGAGRRGSESDSP